MSCPNATLNHDPSTVQEGSVAIICVHSPSALKAPAHFIREMYSFFPNAPTDARYLKFNTRFIDQLAYLELAPVMEPVHKKKDSRGEVTQEPNYQILSRSDAKVGPKGTDHVPFLGRVQTDSSGKLFQRPIVVQWWTKPARSGVGINVCARREDGDAALAKLTSSWNSLDWADALRARVIQPEDRYRRMKALADALYAERFGRRRPFLY